MKKLRIKNHKHPQLYKILFLLLFSISLTALVLYFQPTSFSLVLQNSIKSKFLMPLLNLIPILFLCLLLYYLTYNMYISTSITFIVFVLISLANRYKIIYRDDPLTPTDIMLGKEAMAITKGTGYDIEYKLIIFSVIILILMNLVIYILNFPKPKKKYRLILPAIVIVLSLILFPKVYKSNEVWKILPRGNSLYNITENYNHKGVVYSFLHFFNSYEIKKPDNYDAKLIEDFIRKENKKYENLKNNKNVGKPHIVMIMGEAFSDISNSKSIKFNSPQDDPLYNFKNLEKEALLKGHIIVSSFGGGTANTEYDVLTGNVTTFLNDANISSFRTVRKPINTIVDVLNDNDYDTYGIHPGKTWFYNRQNVYDYFNFKNTIFEHDFKNPNYFSGFISEKDTTKKLFELFKKHDKSKPLFEYCVTIQNHGAYPINKYEDRKINYNFTVNKSISKEIKDTLAVYFEGVRDMDKQIKELSDYFKSIDEPVIFIYYGDHLPYLGKDNLVFKAIDYDISANDLDSTERLYKTPYLIWANEKGIELLDEEFLSSLKDFDDKSINASYLGAILLGLLDLDRENPFYGFINDLREYLNVAQRDFISLKKENFKLIYPDEIDGKLKEKYDFYKNYVYYNTKN